MSCNLPVEDGVRKAADCKCYGAVMRTFSGMSDEPYNIALAASIRVYRHHHPEDSKKDAHLTVESWINQGHAH